MSDRINRAFNTLARSKLRETDTLRIRAMLMHELALRASRYDKGRLRFCLRPCVCALKPWGMITTVIALAVMIGGGTAVAAAQVVIPGHALYGIKLASERVAIALTGDEALGLHMQSTLASRRAEELVLLRIRAAAQSANAEQRMLAFEMAQTAKRLNSSLDKIQQSVAQVKTQTGAVRRLQSVEQNVQTVRQALRQVKGVNTFGSEITEAVQEARATVRKIEEVVREEESAEDSAPLPAVLTNNSDYSQATRQTVENIFAEIAEIEQQISQARTSLQNRGISSTVGIDQDIRVVHLLRAEAAEYLGMNRYEESHGLAQTAVRLGKKVLRMFEERARNGIGSSE